MMFIRSWLFVPGDSERKLEKARSNEADALILDLEDAVADARQDVAREMVRAYLQDRVERSRQQLWVRVNPLDSDLALPDLASVMAGRPDGIVLPKVYSAKDVNTLCNYLSALEAREGIEQGATRILCVATETAASLLTFHTYLEGVTPRLSAMIHI
jgi:citrate lyase subunit beta/citryl-CoA lyase